MAYLNHVTVPSMDSCRSPRAEAADEAVAHVARLLTRARADGRAQLDGPAAHCSLTVRIDSNVLLATIGAPAGPHLPGQPYAGRTMPLATIGVTRKATVAPGLWTLMCVDAGIASPPPRPAWPWIAVRLYPTIATNEAATAWMGDLERLIGWAWIESR